MSRGRKLFLAGLVAILFVVSFITLKYLSASPGIGDGWKDKLVSPGFPISFSGSKNKLQSPSPLPGTKSSRPEDIKYDINTNLEKELETINPQVFDSDFK